MAIDPSKLICPAIFQNFIEGKNGQPLAAGVITFYRDADQVTLKDVYQQTGTPGNYVYTAVNNPLTLSAAGTTVDVNGNDILLFFYPWDETDENVFDPYFITVYDQFGQLQFTRSNFPFVPQEEPGPIINGALTNDNLIINGRFWRNLNTISAGTLNNSWTTQNNTIGTVYYQTVCPDQHDGFSMPDMNYVKNVNGSCTETITFKTFSATTLPIISNDVQPEFYINHNCTADSSGSTQKYYQIPISLHMKTLAGQAFTFTIQGQSVTGATNITVYIYQFCGTGVVSPTRTKIGGFTLTPNWKKFVLNTAIFPPITNLTLGSDGSGGNDDAYYLQIELPVGTTYNLNFCVPSIYLSLAEDAPINDFSSYDVIDTVVASPRTGDVKVSLNNFYPYGWVPMNGGTIAHPNTSLSVVPPTGINIAYQGFDAWALYNLLWNLFSAYGNQITQIYNRNGTIGSFGGSAYGDWNFLKQIAITDTMGQVLLGTVPVPSLTTFYTQTVTATSGGGTLILTAGTPLAFFNGMPVYFTNTGGALPTGISANTIYYVGGFNGTAFGIATTFANAMAGTFIAYTNAGTGTQTVVGAYNGTFEGEYAHTQLVAELAAHSHAPGSGSFFQNVGGVGSTAAFAGGVTNATSAATATTGTSTPFNVTQPGVFFNMFMKL